MRSFVHFIGISALIVLMTTCKSVEQELKVKVETGSVTETGHSFCIIQGSVIDMGKSNIAQHGFCYGTTEQPTIFNDNTQLGSRSTTGAFTDSLLNLQSGTSYYVRAYAQASDEIFYGDQVTFTTLSPTSAVVVIESVGEAANDTVKVTSKVTDDGGSAVTARGVCWSLDQTPTIADNYTEDGSGSGSFSSLITGLMGDTVYYIRAYATTAVSTSYSDQHQVSTPPGGVVISTTPVSGVNMTGAVSGGQITNDGGSAITTRGVCWSASEHPTIADNKTEDGTGTGSFSSSMTGLSPGTTYYVRAYATNASGTYYGEELSFTTTSQSATLPELTTSVVTSITDISAVSGGNITNDGGSSVTIRGVCWSTSHDPDLSDSHTEDGGGTGSYTSAITGLSPNTTYYVRAYATNGEGTSYGSEVSFTTDQTVYLPTLTTTAPTSITANSAVSGGNITDNGGAEVTARGVCWSTSQDPDLAGDHTTDGTGSGSFVSLLSGLDPSTTYYVRAYATNEEGTSFGNQVSFTTGADVSLAVLTTSSVTSITETSAVSGGNITDDGGSAVIARGVCWSTSSGPDLTGDHTTDDSGMGSYASSITGLDPNTTYYVRAYATNGEGTAYGNELSFTTGSSPSLPTLTTTMVSSIATNSAKSGGSITDDGGTTVVARGVCWNISNNPDLSDYYTTDGGGTGTFTSNITGLEPNTTYYVRAYATNSTGTAYGNELSFTTMDMGASVTDIDGSVYPTVIIGTQTWMAMNLKVTHYNNGDQIAQLTDPLDWTATSAGAYCYWDNDIINYGNVYGALYNWYAVDDVRKLCPSGWKVPSDDDWTTLEDFVGGSSIAAAKLKEEGTLHWLSSNNSTNEFGFTALPGGSRNEEGGWRDGGGVTGYWWTSTDYAVFSQGWSRRMDHYSYNTSRLRWYYNTGYSVRCIKE